MAACQFVYSISIWNNWISLPLQSVRCGYASECALMLRSEYLVSALPIVA